jgi:hypothetical protein
MVQRATQRKVLYLAFSWNCLSPIKVSVFHFPLRLGGVIQRVRRASAVVPRAASYLMGRLIGDVSPALELAVAMFAWDLLDQPLIDGNKFGRLWF